MNKLVRVLLPVLVLGVGASVFLGLKATKREPEQVVRVEKGALVTVVRAKRSKEALQVVVHGTVIPARSVQMQPEVSGVVKWKNASLVLGGKVRRGDALLRMDQEDYVLQLENQATQVERARLALQLEQSRHAVALGEWGVIGAQGQATEEGKAVALREPQLRSAQTAVKAAEIAHSRAQLALRRIEVRAPFDALVTQNSTEVGRLVTPQSVLARLVATDVYWVQVSVPIEQLSLIDIPGAGRGSSEVGAVAQVVQNAGTQTVRREGRVLRLVGEVDPAARMARLLVAIRDPLELNRQRKAAPGDKEPVRASDSMPVLLGSYVDVAIQGRTMTEGVELPRRALREGNLVYLFGEDARLHIREVKVVLGRKETVLVTEGVQAGERVILSRVPDAVEGLPLREPTSDPKRVDDGVASDAPGARLRAPKGSQ